MTEPSTAAASVTIEAMTADDWPAVRAIYEQGIATGVSTFETVASEWAAWDAGHRPDCRFVARKDAGRVVGWIALSSFSDRAVYAGVAEVSVYVATDARGRGVGRALLLHVIGASEAAGTWTLQAAIQVENLASIALHESVGFRRVGVREGLGRDATGVWRDVLLLERRSPTVGRGAGTAGGA